GADKQELLRDFVTKCYKPQDYEGFKREKEKSQKSNLIRGWLTEKETKVKGAMAYCQRLKMTKRCKYTGELKFLVELEDRVDDEMLMRLRLEEEMAAIAGNGFEDSFAFNLHQAEAVEAPLEEDASQKLRLPEFPEITQDVATLGAGVKKFKDAALKRRGIYKSVEDRLKEDKSTGHESWELQRIARAADSSKGNHLESLTRNLLRAGYGAQIPIDKIAIPYFGRGLSQHPIFSLEKFLVYMIKAGHAKHFLGGYNVSTEESRMVLSQYWLRYQQHDPGHMVFGNRPLQDTVPLVCYGDEGTGKRKHPVYVLSTKALLNCRNNSMFRYFLYTVIPHEYYRGFQKGSAEKNECLDAVLEHYVLEATRLFQQGWLCLAWMPSPLPLWRCQACPKYVGMQLDVLLCIILLSPG
ncbi:unnamed protein product, partial [Symbiodinium necroappetens]